MVGTEHKAVADLLHPRVAHKSGNVIAKDPRRHHFMELLLDHAPILIKNIYVELVEAVNELLMRVQPLTLQDSIYVVHDICRVAFKPLCEICSTLHTERLHSMYYRCKGVKK